MQYFGRYPLFRCHAATPRTFRLTHLRGSPVYDGRTGVGCRASTLRLRTALLQAATSYSWRKSRVLPIMGVRDFASCWNTLLPGWCYPQSSGTGFMSDVCFVFVYPRGGIVCVRDFPAPGRVRHARACVAAVSCRLKSCYTERRNSEASSHDWHACSHLACDDGDGDEDEKDDDAEGKAGHNMSNVDHGFSSILHLKVLFQRSHATLQIFITFPQKQARSPSSPPSNESNSTSLAPFLAELAHLVICSSADVQCLP